MTFDIKAAKARAEAKRAEAPVFTTEPEILVPVVDKTPEEIQAEIEQSAIEKEAHDQKVLAFNIDKGLKEHKALPEGNTLTKKSFAFTCKTENAMNLFGSITGSTRYKKGTLSSSVSNDVERMCILRIEALKDPVLQAYLDGVDAKYRRSID
ncbi:hypothetical protein AO073_01375 [Pseudomonas syringae ICMP 11293]|uniref:hypothetical protein n=1 Tax=Pseudomonas syringae TaxID=317 RepID=UPI00072FC4FA|nr:hypothetical protein [Pseudomonas syringae]KTB91551.1 hypothetical protein AO073_01375 [Pseudomonas syringae ICMP 11293]